MGKIVKTGNSIEIRVLETIHDMEMVEQLSQEVWPGSELDVVPAHLLLTIAKNGGLLLGAFEKGRLVGFVFGFVGMGFAEDKHHVKHCSHQLGVHPEYQSVGIGFRLKRAQWQLVRKQGLELITWTYDPLLSLNANLNIARLGAVANTYFQELYGQMRDGLNIGMPSDRLQVDWWVNSKRVEKRLSSTPRPPLDLAHFLAAGVPQFNSTHLDSRDLVVPESELLPIVDNGSKTHQVVLFEIPSNFSHLKFEDIQLALRWRQHSRNAFESLFAYGYYITDFVYLPGRNPRSFYVLSFGDSTLGEES